MKILRLATLVLGLAAAAAQPLSAQTFGTEKRLFPHTVASISRDPYIHASGNNVYISWATFNSTTANHEVWVSVSTNNGDTFSTPVNVSQRDAAADQDINPVIVGDGTNVHVFWIDEVAGEDPNGANQNRGRIFYSRSTNNGASFSAPTVIVSQAGYSRVTSAVVSGSQVHLVFYDNRAIAGASIAGKVYHKLSCDNGASWSTETHVTQFDGDVDNEQPRIDKLSTGEIFLVSRSSAGGVPQGGWPPFQVYLLRQASAACPSGATWAYPAQRISRGPDAELGSNYAASIFPGLGGGLHVAWWSDSIASNLAYRYGKPNGAGFGAQQDLSQFGQNHLQWTDMAERAGFGIGEDASGRVHAIFLQNSSTRLTFQTGNIWYRCSPTAGGTFVSKQLATGALASEPRAIYSNNRFHMVWRDFRNTAIDQSEIYYNHVNTVGCAEPPPSSAPTPSTALLDFGGNSMNTTSLIRQLTLTNGGGDPAYCLVPPGIFGYFGDEFKDYSDFDLDKVKEHLDASTYAGQDLPKVTMILRNEAQLNSTIMAEDVSAQLLDNMNLQVELQIMDFQPFRQLQFENTYEMCWIRWYYDYPDPNNGYFDMFYSNKESGKRQAWSNPEFDDWTIKGKEAAKPEDRLAAYRECERLMNEDVAYVPIVYRNAYDVYKPWMKGVPVNKQGYWIPNGNIYGSMYNYVYIEGRPT